MLSAETTTASPIKFGYGPVLYKISLIDLGSFFFSFFLQVRAPAGDVGGGGFIVSFQQFLHFYGDKQCV